MIGEVRGEAGGARANVRPRGEMSDDNDNGNEYQQRK
jgi:hypothetical protein